MQFLYNIFAYIISAVAIPIILWKTVTSDRNYLSFLGIYGSKLKSKHTDQALWVHASSVGEVKAAILLIEKIKKLQPDARMVLTVFTPRGMKVARNELSSDIELQYLPFDIPLIIRKAFHRFNPGLLILIETELWPNLMQQAAVHHVPMMIINGRLSDRNFARYLALRCLFYPLIRRMDYIHTQSEMDAERYLKLGARQESMQSGGNIKTAGILANLQKFDRESVLKELRIPKNVRIIVCGSTRQGEEKVILEAFKTSRQKQTDLKLLLAPRHTVRVEEVEKLVFQYGFSSIKRSEIDTVRAWESDVIILDTMGELWKMYGIGICAFVGGSLVPVGGHNPLESVALGVPTCFGPHMDNARELADKCVREELATVVHDAGDLADFINRCSGGKTQSLPVDRFASIFASDIDMVTDKIISLWEKSDV